MSEIVTASELELKGLFDSHAHYFDKRFAAETEGADRILEREVFGRGVEGVINIGTNPDNSLMCIAQAKKYLGMYATVGIHPEDVSYLDGSVDQELDRIYELVCLPEKRKENKIVAIGEIGLDYHYEGFDKRLQADYFERQLEMAQTLDIPVVIHDRDAHGDCFETVIKYPEVRGVFHSFSGSREMARVLVKRGWYISFSGVLTFKNAKKCVEVAEEIPMDRILIETDCPYLAPHPYRGRINHSGLMSLTAKRLAEIKGLEYEQVVHATRNNVRELFGV